MSESSQISDHIIICGLGHIGFRVFELLNQLKQKIYVISNNTNSEWKARVLASGAYFLEGDASSEVTLIEAGVRQARAILTLTDSDMVNVSIAIDARMLNPSIKIICRMFDTLLGQHIAEAFNVHKILSTSELAAPIFAGNTFGESSIAQFTIEEITYTVSEKTLETDTLGSFLATWTESRGVHLRGLSEASLAQALVAHPISRLELTAKKYRVIKKSLSFLISPHSARFRQILLIISIFVLLAAVVLKYSMSLTWVNAFYFVITTVTTVGYGDFSFSASPLAVKLFGCLLMLGGAALLAMMFSAITDLLLTERFQNIWGGQPIPEKNHVIVVGAGHLGTRVVNTLVKQGVPVVVIEDEKQGNFSEDIKRQVAVVEGNARNHETLKTAGVHSARSILTITDDDVENLGISLAARALNPTLIAPLRIFDSRLGQKLEGQLSVGHIMSVSSIAAPYFVASIFTQNVLLALCWKNELLFIAETLDENLDSIQVNPISLKGLENASYQIYSIPLLAS